MAMASSIACTSADCSPMFLHQPPALAGNAVLLALFAILIPVALLLGIRYRSLGFVVPLAGGLALEVVGYIGRILLHSYPDSRTDFAVFLVGTTLGPTCICGAMFLIVPRIVAVYGDEYRSWRPAWYLLLLSLLTVVSLVLELAGSVVSTAEDDPAVVNAGSTVLVVGLVFQLLALGVFVMHAVLFAIALRTRRHSLDPEFASVYNSNKFTLLLVAFIVATTLIVLRTTYRTVQIAEGFRSSIAQAETLFLVLDGAAMLIATIWLLACFPARALGESWSETSVRRLSQRSRRQSHSVSIGPPIAQPSPTYNRMSIKSSGSAHSPRKATYPAPTLQRDMVDSDNLW
ncbi:hypothetical protein F5Y14DRAFT_79575 [Nemania sp. NC0429]|nr:hypothetical protein F5Y14DRAFT_79575 [Nemania sp. NC0429]